MEQCKKGLGCSGEGLEEERTCLTGRIRKGFLSKVVAELSPEGWIGQMEKKGDQEGSSQ